MGWHQRALQAGRTIYLNRPDSLDATITYSRALMNAGMAELALPLATAVLQEDPTHPSATKLRIWCDLLLGRHERAKEAGKPYLAAHQGDANTRWAVALASAHLPFGVEDAVRISLDALQADDSDLTVWLLLGYLHARRDDEIAARNAWAEGAARIEKDSVGVNHRTIAWAANIYAAMRDVAATLNCVDYLIRNDGANGYIRYRLFHALAELGHVPAAVEMLDSAVTCGFMSLQLLRQEEILAPWRMRTHEPYRRVVTRLEGVVRSAKDTQTSRNNIRTSKEPVRQ
jgi:tetratricopeptide (TPR) repeat protein